VAKMIQAVQKLGPKVVYGPPAKIGELAGWMARSSGLNPNAGRMALGELSDAMLFYLRRGSSVILPGLGRFRLTLARDGKLHLRIMPERSFLVDVRDTRHFVGKKLNPEREKWTNAEYKAAWDELFPDDPLELPAAGEPDEPGEPQDPPEPAEPGLAQAA